VAFSLCNSRTRRDQRARRDARRRARRASADEEVYALYHGTGSVDQVLSARCIPSAMRGNETRCSIAHLYLGLYFDACGDRAKAREHISKAANDFGAEHYMGAVARVHLRVLECDALIASPDDRTPLSWPTLLSVLARQRLIEVFRTP